MEKITCNVIRDLLPLYVDGVLSEDSSSLVEPHLSTCEGCSEYFHALKASVGQFMQKKNSDDKAALKKIRKKIHSKRLLTVVITAVCAVFVIGLSYHAVFFHEKYIPYEEAGLYVSEQALRTSRNYYKGIGVFSPDGETIFLYMTTTAYTELKKEGALAGAPIVSLKKDDLTHWTWDDNGNVTGEQVCHEIYYIPEEPAKQFMQAIQWTDAGNTEEEIKKNQEKEVEELKAASVLIWSAEQAH